MAEVKDYPPYLDYPKERKKQTNADKIRQMTDEELAALLKSNCPTEKCPYLVMSSGFDQCYRCWLDWLKQEVRDGDA